MEKVKRLYMKLSIIMIGIIILILIVLGELRNASLHRIEKDYIKSSTVKTLVTALRADEKNKIDNILNSDKEYLSYNSYWKIIKLIDEDVHMTDNDKTEYQDNYVEKEIWYDVYDKLLTYYDTDNGIQKKIISILAKGKNVEREDGSILEENILLSLDGNEIRDENQLYNDANNSPMLAYVKGDELLAIRKKAAIDTKDPIFEDNDDYKFEKSGNRITLFNVWIKNAKDKKVSFFYKQHIIHMQGTGETEQIADIQIQDGKIKESDLKKDKISGKVLRVDKDSMTLVLEGRDSIPISTQMNTYKIHGVLQEVSITDIVIGYQFTDFIIKDGKICAALITKDDDMQTIRVLLRNSDYNGIYHDTVALTADSEYEVSFRDDKKRYQSSEILQVDDFALKEGERIYVKPVALSAKISISSIHRAVGTPEYRGTLEIEKREEGYVLINELLLEEYLYAVVPSEMPSSYPEEALRAQAICARTYAYKSMLHAGLSEYGAHVDDSTSYQVYHNINEETSTTDAVNATKGKILRYGEELVGAYYYSTSCGYGTNACVWNGNEKSDFPYLKAKHINQEDSEENLFSEESFQTYITTVNNTDFEKDESWYRWNYTVEKLDPDTILSRLKERYQVNPSLILTKTDGENFESKDIKSLGDVRNIYVLSRNEGGVISELMIEGSKSSFKVLTEYNIRYVLSDGVSKVIKQDQSESGPSMLLPSAFAIIQPNIDKNKVVGYSIIGGGFGHGVGMSQNAAKDMAANGFSCEDIIHFFYEGSQISSIYE